MKRKLLKNILTLGCALATACSVAACSPSDSKNSAADYNETLICGFDSQEEILTATLGRKELREYKAVTDEQFVTQGKAALKVTHNSQEHYNYMPTVGDLAPSVEVLFSELGLSKDFTSVKSVALDVYNPQDRAIEIKLYFMTVIQETTTKEFIADTAYLLPNSMNRCVFDLHLDKFVNFGLDDVQKMCFLLPSVAETSETMTLYMDNLRFRTFKGNPVYNDQTLPVAPTNGMITSFEEKAMFNKTDTTTAWHSWLPYHALTAYWNDDPTYVSEGSRSLAVVAPCHGDVFRYERSYAFLALPSEYVQNCNFLANDSETAALKVDVYFKSPIDNSSFSFLMTYEKGTATATVRSNVVLKANEWNTVEIPLHTGSGVNADWSKVLKISFQIYQLKGGGNVTYYFDNIRVEG